MILIVVGLWDVVVFSFSVDVRFIKCFVFISGLLMEDFFSCMILLMNWIFYVVCYLL